MYKKDMRALVQMARENEIPISGMFELTSKCNLNCGFCYVYDRNKQMNKPTEKTTEEWLSLIRQAVDNGMLKCAFTGGDPFMREDFEEIYCKAYDMGLRISILTNAILIGKKQRTYLLNRIPDLISVSLYGASDETYQTVCGGVGNYRRTMEALDGLHAAGIAFELKVLAMRPLINEYESMGRITAKYHCSGKFDPYICPGRDDPERNLRNWRIPPDQIVGLLRSFRKPLDCKSWTPTEKRDIRPGGAFYCGAGKSNFFITYDGRMLGCPSLTCFDTYPFRDGFSYAWNELKDLIGEAEVCIECKNCLEKEKCFICPAERLCETGSISICSPYLRELVCSLAALEQEASG